MKILIDFTQSPNGATGVRVYAEELVIELALLLGPGDDLLLLVQDDERVLLGKLPEGRYVRILRVPARVFRSQAALTLLEQAVLPLLLWWHRVDIVHSLHYRFPLLPPCARVVTIHDLTHTLWLQLHTRGCRWIFHNFSRMAMQRAEGTLFVLN